MAVLEISGVRHYVGLSTDAKPTAEVSAGSRFWERDTGDEFIYDGSAWGRVTKGDYRRATKSITFDATAGKGQAATNTTWFTVTGEVLVRYVIGFCTLDLTEAAPTATITLGVTGSTALFIAATNAVDLDANEFWVDATPDARGVALPAALKETAITDDILSAVAVANINGGTLRIDVWWMLLSANGNLVAA